VAGSSIVLKVAIDGDTIQEVGIATLVLSWEADGRQVDGWNLLLIDPGAAGTPADGPGFLVRMTQTRGVAE
jgi:hypothetical protein